MIRYLTVRNLLMILMAVALSGCGTTSLRQAQDHFNTAADIEARALNASLRGDNVNARPGDSIIEYRLAYATATEVIAKKSDDLRRDKLLGATYVLKAMALWRISDLQGDPLTNAEKSSTDATMPAAAGGKSSPATIDNARQQLLAVLNVIQQLHDDGKLYLGTRDKVLHRALYGFYDHDGGRAAADYDTAESWFESALKQLDDAVANDVPAQHPVRVYVGSAQLRTLGAWNKFIGTGFQACKLDSTRAEGDCRKDRKARRMKVNDKTQMVVCELELFWADNENIKRQFGALTAVIGLVSAMDRDQCNS